MDRIPSTSPLEQATAAKRRRDIGGEIDAIMTGDRALRSAPWYPARPGDLLTLHYETAANRPAWYETYTVQPGADGLELQLLDHTPGDGFASLAGFLAGPDEFGDDPFTTPWMEAGPRLLSIVRDGVTLHDGPRRTGGIASGGALVQFDGEGSVTLFGATLLDLDGGRTQLGGWIDADVSWVPFHSASVVRAEVPGRAPFAVDRVALDQTNYGTPHDYLTLEWPIGREAPCQSR